MEHELQGRQPDCKARFLVSPLDWWPLFTILGFPGGAMVKSPHTSAADLRDKHSTPGLARSPGGENGNPLQYSCLANFMTEEPGGLQSTGSKSVGHDWAHIHTNTHTHTLIIIFPGSWTLASEDGKKDSLLPGLVGPGVRQWFLGKSR